MPIDELTRAQQAPAIITPDASGELVRWVLNLQEEAAKRKKKDANEERWKDWEQGWWGENHWPSTMPSYKASVVVNTGKTRSMQEISDLTEQPMKIFVTKDPQNGERDEMVEKAIQAYWSRSFMDYQVMQACYHAWVLPCGFIGTFWDKDKDNGAGQIDCKSLHPNTVFPDPDAHDDESWRYVNLLQVMDVTEIRRLWPLTGATVRPDDDYSVKQGSTLWNKMSSVMGGGFSKYLGPLYDKGMNGVQSQGYLKARAAVISCWVYDDETEETIEEISNPTTGERSLSSRIRKKYPNGRLIQVANDTLLYDGPNPYWGRFPITRVSLQLHDGFWPPVSCYGDVFELYKAGNKLDSAVIENAMRLNCGKVIADANSGIKPGRYTNSPAEVLLKTPGTNVNIVYPPAMPPDMVNAGARMRQYADEVQGFPSSRTGMGQGGNVAAELVETEIGQAQGLSRLRGRLLHMSVEKVVQQIMLRMAQFYRTPRMIPHISGEKWSPVQWDPSMMGDQKDYLAHVDPSSFAIKSKTMLQRLYLQLAQLGKMPDRDLLKCLDIPDADAVAGRLEEQLKLAAEARMRPKREAV